jgi:AmiR/NasT family two-component response regulator
LPVTAGDDERLCQRADERERPPSGLIAVYAERVEMAETLMAACQSGGYSAVWMPPDQNTLLTGARAVVWDAPPRREKQHLELRMLTEQMPHAPIVALVNFPRIEDQHRLVGAGAAAVLSKPLEIDGLLGVLDHVARC